jgi:hypothetical protein
VVWLRPCCVVLVSEGPIAALTAVPLTGPTAGRSLGLRSCSRSFAACFLFVWFVACRLLSFLVRPPQDTQSTLLWPPPCGHLLRRLAALRAATCAFASALRCAASLGPLASCLGSSVALRRFALVVALVWLLLLLLPRLWPPPCCCGGRRLGVFGSRISRMSHC